MKKLCLACALIASLSALAPPLGAQTALFDVMLAHVAAGGGYTSYLNVSDPIGAGIQNIQMFFYDDAGQPMALSVDGGAPVTGYTLSLTPWSGRSLVLTSAQLRSGWARIACPRGYKVNVSLRFAFMLPNGTVTDAVGILPSEPNTYFSLTVDRRTPNDYIGVAVVNPRDSEVEVSFDLWQGTLRVPGTATAKRTLAARGHLAVFLHQLFPAAAFEGAALLEISTSADSADITAVALRGDGSQYSSLPANQSVETWDWTITNDSGQAYWNGRWCLRFESGPRFAGVSTDNSQTWNIWGSYSKANFTLESFLSFRDGGWGIMTFHGTWKREGQGAAITGKYMEIRENGTVDRTYNFRAVQVP